MAEPNKAFITRITDEEGNTTFPITKSQAVFVSEQETLDTKLADTDKRIDELEARPVSATTRILQFVIECDGYNWIKAENATEEAKDVLDRWNAGQNSQTVIKPREENPIHWIMKVTDDRIFCAQPYSWEARPIGDITHQTCAEEDIVDAEDDYHFEGTRNCGIAGVAVLEQGSIWLCSTCDAELDITRPSYEKGPSGSLYYCDSCTPESCFQDTYVETCPLVGKDVDRSKLNEVWYPCNVYRRPYAGKFGLIIRMITSKSDEDLYAEGVNVTGMTKVGEVPKSEIG